VKSILELSNIEAKQYFLKEESYFNFDLPSYFVFQKLLDDISNKIEGKLLSDFYGSIENDQGKKKPTYPSDYENVNYKFLTNKDGKFSWRPFQLIHPALYVSLVHKITSEKNWNSILKRFKKFDKHRKIQCYSLPIKSEGKSSDKAETVNNWWHSIEQQSIELALKYEYVLHIDIADCYGSIYTHSIPWALHTKKKAKEEKNNKQLIGNIIDKHLQDMSYGQTNGIPQGSVLMDFIAEIVLGYADLKLSKKIKNLGVSDYHIIRYRDDYRIFSNNPQEAELIVKSITEIITEFGMRLNAQKTLASHNIVEDSVKPDKLYWLLSKNGSKSLQKHLFVIYKLSREFPNSGSLNKALDQYFNRVNKIKKTKENLKVIVSILVDIAYKNPRTYPIVAAILSKIFSLINSKKKVKKLLKLIDIRFNKIPNTGYLELWLQRIIIKTYKNHTFDEVLCEKVTDPTIVIWKSEWLNKQLQTIIQETPIIDKDTIKSLNKVIEAKEVQLFESKSSYW